MLRSLIIIADELDLVVVVVEQSTQVELVIVLLLELDRVVLLRSLLAEHQLGLGRIVLEGDDVALVVAECDDCVVLCGVDGGP